MNIWQDLLKNKRPFLVLAPMDDVTETSFRQLIAEVAAPDLFFTEFANVDGLQSAGRSNVLQKLKFTQRERPLIAQIWGLQPDNFQKTAAELVTMGFDGIDLNMGCPVRVVTKKGACSGLINNPPLASEIIKATQDGAAGQIPVSVKTRIGFNNIQTEEWSSFLLEHKLSALIMHGRTSKEQSKVANHWEEIAKLPALRDQIAPKTAIIGNGDVLSRQQGLELAEVHNLDGIMICRGIFQDPRVFAGSQQPLTARQAIELYLRHIDLFEQTWGETKNASILKKFAKMYLRDFEGASDVRSAVMTAQTFDEMRSLLKSVEQ